MGQEFKINDCGEIIRKEQVTTKKTNWWALVSLFLFFALCILSCALYYYCECEYYSKRYISSLHKKLYAKEQELSLISEDGFGIHSIEFGNCDFSGNTLTGYGRPLYSSKMRYLKPRIIYYATGTKNVVFQYKIFYPDGTLKYNSDYSEEFTVNSHHVTLYAGKKNKVKLRGWGHSKESTYHPGTYSIEIWYNGRCVKKQSFEIL